MIIAEDLESKNYPTIPLFIDLDVSKKTHFIGRVPNPAVTAKGFKHKTQHVIPLSFLSSTHCSVSKEISHANRDEINYYVRDYSSNGTFIRRGSDEIEVGQGKILQIYENDVISFKFKGTSSICYKFSTHSIDNSPQNFEQQQVIKLQEELLKVESRLASTSNKLETFQKDCSNQNRQIIELKETLETKDLEIKELGKNLQIANDSQAAAEAYAFKLKRNIEDNKIMMTELKLTIEKLTDDLKHKNEQVTNRNHTIENANRIINEQNDNINNFQIITTNQTQQISKFKERIRRLSMRHKDIRGLETFRRQQLCVLLEQVTSSLKQVSSVASEGKIDQVLDDCSDLFLDLGHQQTQAEEGSQADAAPAMLGDTAVSALGDTSPRGSCPVGGTAEYSQTATAQCAVDTQTAVQGLEGSPNARYASFDIGTGTQLQTAEATADAYKLGFQPGLGLFALTQQQEAEVEEHVNTASTASTVRIAIAIDKKKQIQTVKRSIVKSTEPLPLDCLDDDTGALAKRRKGLDFESEASSLDLDSDDQHTCCTQEQGTGV